jgi:tyrosine-protein kinase
MTEMLSNRPTSLADYLRILRRHWWVIAIPLVVAPLGAFIVSSAEQPLYSATASVYINRTPATATATGVYDQSASTDPVRFFQTQADLARDPVLLERVARSRRATGVGPGELASSSSVYPSVNADLLIFSVQNRNGDTAASLANAYAAEFTKFQPEQTVNALSAALKTVRQKIADLRAHGTSSASAVYSDLVTRESQLSTALVLQGGNAPHVVQPAGGGAKIRPRPKRNALLGLVLGGILGIGLAFLREALDKRVRSEDDIETLLGLPLLGRLPKPARELRQTNQLVMLADPSSPAAEAVRKVRTNLEFVNIERGYRTIMISSSLEQEGKSTTLANLAVALARAGRRVALVDLDLRRPYLHRFFRIGAAPGITDVIGGRYELEQAMRVIPIAGGGRALPEQMTDTSENGKSAVKGLLGVLPAGTIPEDPGEFILDGKLHDVIGELKGAWDVVLIDAPPMSAVGDALTLSANVDAIVVMTRLGVVQTGMIRELARQLEAAPAEKIGFIVSGAERGAVYGYAYGYGYEAGRGERDARRDEERVP